MKKPINKWMISTIVITLLSMVIIGFLSFKLMNQPTMAGPDGQQMPNGERPSGERPEGNPPGMDGQQGETQESSITANDNGI